MPTSTIAARRRNALAFTFFAGLVLCLAALTAAAAEGASRGDAGAGQPDLTLVLDDPMTEQVRVRNTGSAPSAPTKLVIGCRRVALDLDQDCPSNPGLNDYSVPGFPDARVVEVASIAPGETAVVEVPHWRDLIIDGADQTYEFRVEVDPDDVVAEANESNNIALSKLFIL